MRPSNRADDGTEAIQYVWATKELKPTMPKNGGKVKGVYGISEKIDGMPLKVELQIDQAGMGMTITMTATKVNTDKPSKDLFEIPAGYTVEAFDPSKLMGR